MSSPHSASERENKGELYRNGFSRALSIIRNGAIIREISRHCAGIMSYVLSHTHIHTHVRTGRSVNRLRKMDHGYLLSRGLLTRPAKAAGVYTRCSQITVSARVINSVREAKMRTASRLWARTDEPLVPTQTYYFCDVFICIYIYQSEVLLSDATELCSV